MKVLLIHDKDLSAVRLDAPAEAGEVSSPRAGGLAVYLATLTRALRAAGDEVVTLGFGETRGPENRDGAWTLPAFRFRFREEIARRVEEIVAEENPDLIHLQSVTSLHPRLAARLRRMRPLAWTFHDVSGVCFQRTLVTRGGEVCEHALGYGCLTRGCYVPGKLEPLPRDLLRIARHRIALKSFRAAESVAVPSHYLKAVLERNGVAKERVSVLPLFARYEFLAPAPPPRNAPPHVLFAGRLSRAKGVDELVRALGLLRELHWTASFAGDGPRRSELERLCRDAGIADRVRLTGELSIDALSAAYRDADLVAMPSMAPESFGLVGVEAMAHARPVVAFDCGGIGEWLIDGSTGLAARRGDVAHLAQKIRRLLESPAERQAFGAAAFELQRERFTSSVHIAALQRFHEQTIDRQMRAAS